MLRIAVTSYIDNMNAGTTDQTTMVVPNGYVKLVRFLFNPEIDSEITMNSQKSKVAILDGFRTKIGTFGVLDIPSNLIQDDRYIIKFTNREGVTKNLFLTAIFESA